MQHLRLPPNHLVFVDDRRPNVEAAARAGIAAIHFESAEQLAAELRQLGLRF